MLIVLSPAKSLDYESVLKENISTVPELLDDAAELAGIASQLTAADLARLMTISPALAELNAARFSAWKKKPAAAAVRPAVFAFNGDVYEGLQAASLNAAELAYLQQHLRILSGLYGILRPLDRLQAYRLEMGTRLSNRHGSNLYAFWGDKVTQILKDLASHEATPVLLNLASEEYFKVVKPKLFAGEIITPVFQDWKNGHYKIISFYAKRARGLMARYCAEHAIDDVRLIQAFDVDGYAYSAEESDQQKWVFRRKLA
ncbi:MULTISPECIES: peroxide stress protein YaaA [unclassified Undibacterium]|uniref:peroxide stress protein YaaA n=1 Tax=unclassified Undibacterium TaxID=2630295 RepID=UPI002AC9E22B|nr:MULTISPECIES: peroxide stress protein YaaA [unclassified Undibacterium]MEB0141051.1 peroxide stress protein YaaA [Undibacterium sp. CCC2.1]MEB0174037.1 peroxide stress protein YaaA [Undibacterium sp. CCC1.1]MEB0178006.1 peroxide stress protein YaaA [Undibacterium sp. CCC3.4]MEB0217222.1 peroxide stress protein YaaA [Undibacterium sp. 5I2]WPX43275.1 peroxide stress protein YaaA [Undibacterium sp. CCC3.4]